MLRAAVGFAARGVYISDMMLPLLICLAAASAANETSIAYYESPSMVSVPQGLRFSTIWTSVQDQTAGFPLQAHRERPHMGRCPLSQGVESLALHTHVSRDTTGTLAPRCRKGGASTSIILYITTKRLQSQSKQI